MSFPRIETEHEVVGVFELGQSQLIVVQRTEFNGKRLIDIRKHYPGGSATDPEPTWLPTRKGIAIKPEDASEVISLIEEALKE